MTSAAPTARRLVLARSLGETWSALVEGSRVDELSIRPEGVSRTLGTIVKARVINAAHGVRGAFLDAGLGRDVFLALGRPGTEPLEAGLALQPGAEVLVQIIREADGGKGHRATLQVTLPGWLLVLSPRLPSLGVSRRIEDLVERQRLREILERVAPAGHGLIARTSAAGAQEADLAAEAAALGAQWDEIAARAAASRAPAIVHREEDLAAAFVREHLAVGIDQIVVDGLDASALEAAMHAPHGVAVPRVVRHPGPLPAIEAYRLEQALDEILSASVPLPSGGRLVIEHTEALTAIDVNSGRDLSRANLAETALGTNLEAVGEVARQARLRDLGGLMIVDFIDMLDLDHRSAVDRALAEAFAADRARVRMLPLSEFCLAQITRQRRGAPLERMLGRTAASGTLATAARRAIELNPEAEGRRLMRQLGRTARPLPAATFRVVAPAEVLAAAREIYEDHGVEAGLPDPRRIQWREGEFAVEIL